MNDIMKTYRHTNKRLYVDALEEKVMMLLNKWHRNCHIQNIVSHNFGRLFVVSQDFKTVCTYFTSTKLLHDPICKIVVNGKDNNPFYLYSKK